MSYEDELPLIPDDLYGETPDPAAPVLPETTTVLQTRGAQRVDRRSDWNARPPRSNPGGFTSLSGTICHHVGAPRGYVLPITADHERCRAQVRGVQNHALTIPNMSDIHYNAMACVHGVVFEGRIEGVRGGANGTANSNSTEPSICALTGVDDQPTQQMLDAIAWFHREVERRARTSLNMRPHQAVVSTSCAGSALNRWVNNGGWRAPAPTPDPEPPLPPIPGETVIIIAAPEGANARFLATSDGRGFISSMAWIPDEATMARLTPHYPVVTIEPSAPSNIALIGPLPVGDGLRNWTWADFLNAGPPS